jgi:hypothetical protein
MGQHLVCAARKNEPCGRLADRPTPLPRFGDRGPGEGQRNAEAQCVDCVRIVQVPQYAPIKYAGHEAGEFFFVPAI